MPNHHFIQARLKVEWATRHIKNLEANFQRLAGDINFYRLFVEKDSNDVTVIAVETKPLHPAFALTIGDAIHCFRSALDYVTSDIARRAGKDSSRIHFPFEETRDRLVTSATYRKIERIAPDVAALIADVIKPTKTDNFPLWALNKLDNIDKHRLLIPVLWLTAIHGVCAESSSGIKVTNTTLVAIGPDRVPFIGMPGDVKITNYGKPSFDIRFDKGQFFDNQPIIPTLLQLGQLVAGIIKALEAHCFGAKQS